MSDDAWRFDGFPRPNYTRVPDVVFDELLHRLGDAELRALLYIVRRTEGFGKESDPISFTQFMHGIVTHDGRQLDRGCGIRSRTTLSAALRSLEEKGIIETTKSPDDQKVKGITTYSLRFQGVVQQTYHPSTATGPGVVQLLDLQETVQKTEVDQPRISLDDRLLAATDPKAVKARPPRP